MVYNRRKVRLIESSLKCHLQKLTFEGTWRQVFFLSEAPSPPRFLFGVVNVYTVYLFTQGKGGGGRAYQRG